MDTEVRGSTINLDFHEDWDLLEEELEDLRTVNYTEEEISELLSFADAELQTDSFESKLLTK